MEYQIFCIPQCGIQNFYTPSHTSKMAIKAFSLMNIFGKLFQKIHNQFLDILIRVLITNQRL